MSVAQRALVTGGGARLGKAMCIALARGEYDVAVHYRSSKTGAENTAQQIKDLTGRTACLVQADLSVEEDCLGLIADATEQLGGALTLLVNSASVFEADTAETHSKADWDLHISTNLRAPIVLSQAFAAQAPQDANAQIVNIIDQRVLKPNPQFFTYTLSKAALWAATKTLAQSFAPHIRVNGIGPGPTLASIHQSPEEFDKEVKATLTGKGANPSEILKALSYLIKAKAVTGQMIAVDGGQHLLWQTPDLMDSI